MSILTTHNLGKYYGGHDVFAGLSLTAHHGDRIALVGPNGQGKTTLLRILAGLEPPSAGQVVSAKGLKMAYLDQHPSLKSQDAVSIWTLALAAFAELRVEEVRLREMEATLDGSPEALAAYGEAQARFERNGGYQYEQTIDYVLTGLGFTAADYHAPLTQLSGGQQSRAHLARLLLEQPDLLLLDEPTNHLDLASVEWLESYLQTWKGVIIIVAHDRYFLDKVATRVWELAHGTVETYRGNFSHYVQQRAERMELRRKEYEAQQEFVAKEQAFIQRNLAGQRTKEAQGRRKRLERMPMLERPQDHKTFTLPIQTTLRSGDLVLATHAITVGYDAPLFTCPDLEIRRGQCVALLGPNGSGKTTFVKTILGQLEPLGGHIRLGAGVEIGYFAQTQSSLNLDATILDEILSVRNLPIGEARNYLGRFLFSGDDVFKTIGSLSGGQRSRVALAKLAMTGANFLILDEPTNHLDIMSQEGLEDVLSAFEGTILMVSHDRYFVDALASHVWAIDPAAQTVITIAGGYSDYLAYREQLNQQQMPQNGTAKSSSQKDRERTKAEKRAAEKKARQVAELESLIEATEARLTRLTEELELASQKQDLTRLQDLGRDYQHTETELDALLNQWADLEEEAT